MLLAISPHLFSPCLPIALLHNCTRKKFAFLSYSYISIPTCVCMHYKNYLLYNGRYTILYKQTTYRLIYNRADNFYTNSSILLEFCDSHQHTSVIQQQLQPAPHLNTLRLAFHFIALHQSFIVLIGVVVIVFVAVVASSADMTIN